MPYRAILFDLDGTLVDSITLYAEAVLASLKEIGIETDMDTFHDWYTRPLHLAQILALHGLDEGLVPELRTRRDERYVALLASKSEWLPGGKELMEHIRTNAIPTALITGSWMSYVDAIDSRLGVKRYFPQIITAEEIHRFMKPHPHGLLLACDRLGVDPSACLYIGDQQFDVDAANAAGMESWVVRGRWSPGEVANANRAFDTARDMIDALTGKG